MVVFPSSACASCTTIKYDGGAATDSAVGSDTSSIKVDCVYTAVMPR